jgi:hypothetical protein
MIEDAPLVWKVCRSVATHEKVFVGLRVLGKTNEKRAGVCNEAYAKFRTSRAHVSVILAGKSICLEAESCCYPFLNKSNRVRYRMGEEVSVDNWDDNDNGVVCGPGIHYYKCIDAARSHDNNVYDDCGCELGRHDVLDFTVFRYPMPQLHLALAAIVDIDKDAECMASWDFQRPLLQRHSNFVTDERRATELERVERVAYDGIPLDALYRMVPKIPWLPPRPRQHR